MNLRGKNDEEMGGRVGFLVDTIGDEGRLPLMNGLVSKSESSECSMSIETVLSTWKS